MVVNIEKKKWGYYDFLTSVHEVSKNTRKVQMNSIKIVFDAYGADIVKKRIDREIARIDKLLLKK